MESNKSGDQGASDEEPGNEGEKDSREEFSPLDMNARVESKPFTISIVVLLTVIAGIGITFWEIADGLHGFGCTFLHWLSLSSAAGGVVASFYKSVENKKWIWLSFGIASAALAVISYIVWPFQLPWTKPPQTHSFKVSAGPTSNTPQERQWYVANGVNTPYHCAALISFKNLLPTPLLIESYTVEEEVSSDKWRRVDLQYVSMAGEDGGAFFDGSVTDADEVIYTTFDQVISNKNIEPNETARGWIFLKRMWWTNPLRFTIEDSSGQYYSEFLQPSGIPNPVQPMMITIGRRHVNISAVPIAK